MIIRIKKPEIKNASIILLAGIFILAFYMRINYVLNNYPLTFIDYAGHTLSVLNVIPNFWTLFQPGFTQVPEWYKISNNFLDQHWWFQINPPLPYILSSMLIPFVNELKIVWISGALFFSLGVFSIYYFINYFLKNKKFALIGALFYATTAGDIYSISRAVFMHALAMTIYPILIVYTHKELTNHTRKNFCILTALIYALINSYTAYIAVYIIGLIIYYMISNIHLSKNKIIIKTGYYKKIILSMLIATGLSTTFLIRFMTHVSQNLGVNSYAPLNALIDIELLGTYFPSDSFGLHSYRLTSIIEKALTIAFSIILIYKLIFKNKNKPENNKELLFFFSGALIFYLLQFIGFASYPRRMLYHVPFLFSIASAIGLYWITSLLKGKSKTIIITAIIIATLLTDAVNNDLIIKWLSPNMNIQMQESINWMRENIPENETLYFLNSDNYVGFSVWSKFTYRKSIIANSTVSKQAIISRKINEAVTNYNYVVLNDILPTTNSKGLKTVNPLVNEFSNKSYQLAFYNGQVGIFARKLKVI